MKMLKYTGEWEEDLEPPTDEKIRELEAEGRIAELLRRLLEWKGEADVSYFQRQWDLLPHELEDAVDKLEDVEVEERNATL